MKKISILVAGVVCMLTTGCGSLGSGMLGGNTGTASTSSTGDVLGSILGSVTNGETIGNVLGSVIGLNKVSQEQLYGTWKYSGPGCAFTSNNALAKAGGEVMATQIEQKLEAQYSKLGLNAGNTAITFNENGTFAAKVGGRSWNGNYTYDASTGAINMKGLLLNLSGFITRNGSGISVLFESKKLLSLVQTVSALSGNTTLSTIGDLSKNYDGVRLGFDMSK